MSLQVKVCGISTGNALEAAIGAGADAAGFVFFPRSPRHVSIQEAVALARYAQSRIKTVALFVDPSDAVLEATLPAVSPNIVQLHGKEPPARVAEIKARFGLPVIKAIGLSHAKDLEMAAFYLDTADLILFDAKPDNPKAALPGGNGIAFDWTLLKNWPHKAKAILSGGLNPDNVVRAITTSGIHFVDVSSGVETSPGVKNSGLIRRFAVEARSALVSA